MSSGVSVSEECIKAFQDLKLRKKHKYIIFNLNEKSTEVIVQRTSESEKYDDFVADLPADQCRWAVYDFEFNAGEGKRNKLCFFSWSPDTAKVRSKMVFASSREALRRKLDGIAMEIQGTERSEVEHETVLAKAKLGTR